MPNWAKGSLKLRGRSENIASALKEIGFDGVCTIEEFRPEYYEMSHDENVKKAAEVTREFVNKYF